MQQYMIRAEKENQKSAPKRLPVWLAFVLLAVSFILAEFIPARNAMYAFSFTLGMSNVFSSSPVNFLFYILIGAAYWGIFELIIFLAFRFMRINAALKYEYGYYIRLVGAGANILIFGIRFLYFAAPFMQFLIEAVFVTIIMLAAFFILIKILIKKNVMPEPLKGAHIKFMSSFYFGFMLIITLFNIFSAVA